MPAFDAAAATLEALLPQGRVLASAASFAGYLHDEGEWAVYGDPLAVVRPESTGEVAAVVRWCAETGTPLVARGAGTGLSGAANALEGCVVVSFERMNAILEVNEAERWARVQPGVVNDDLRAHVAQHGLWYPPDPASSPWSTSRQTPAGCAASSTA